MKAIKYLATGFILFTCLFCFFACKDHEVIVDKAFAPTCTETGLTEGKHCSICNKVLVEQEVVEATGHTVECNSLIYAEISDDGSAYIPLYDGACIKINDEVDTAVMTRDRENIIVLLEDGTLYVTNKELSPKKVIADNCDLINYDYIRDDGFFYECTDGGTYRFQFSDSSSLLLGEFVEMTVAEKNTTVLYALEGKIYVMAHSSSERERVGVYENNIDLQAVSDSGDISVWSEREYTSTFDFSWADYLCVKGDKYELGKNKESYYTSVSFSKDQKGVLISSNYSDTMWYKAEGSELAELKLGAEMSSRHMIYADKGMIGDQNVSEITSFYIATMRESGTHLYNIDLEGNRERVLSNIEDFTVSDGKVFYSKGETGNLYYADINGFEIKNEAQIANDIYDFSVSENGKYVYYSKNYDDGFASIYCYKLGENESQKIASDCYAGGLFIGEDSDTVFYMKDYEKIENSYRTCGTLMKWNYESGESERIAGEVILLSWDSGTVHGLNPNSFTFAKYSSVDSSGRLLVDLMYFNGEESVKLASDIID